MTRKLGAILTLCTLAGVAVLGGCNKSEYRSTSIHTSTNDDGPAPTRQKPAALTDEDWDFVAPQGQMVVDPQ